MIQGRNYYLVLYILCFIASMVGGTVSTLMSVYLPVVVRELPSDGSSDINAVSGYINALFIYGWAIGGFTWGFISDRIGRKKALLLAITCYGTFTLLTGLMSTWWMISVCRIFSGFGVGGVLVVSFTLLSEVWPERSRAVFVGILSIAFPMGIFSAGLINYLLPSWREGFMIGIVPLLVALIGSLVLQESESWKKQKEQGTGSATPFSNVHKRELITGSITFGSMLIGLWAIFSWLPTWVQQLSISADAGRERGLSMMCLGVGGLTGGFFSGWLVKWLGPRKSMMVCFTVCALLSFLLFKTNNNVSGLVFAEIGILAFFFGASQGVLSSYIPQLFPTPVRATATGFCFNIGRLFTATAVLFVGLLVTVLGGFGNALYIFSLVFPLGLISTFWLKKTT